MLDLKNVIYINTKEWKMLWPDKDLFLTFSLPLQAVNSRKDDPEIEPLRHEKGPKEPGFDHNHSQDDEKVKEQKRVWDEQHPSNLPPKKH